MSKTTITINGRLYDAITGQPVVTPQSTPAPRAGQKTEHQLRAFSDIGPQKTAAKSHPAVQRSSHPNAHAVHAAPQKSQTLYRKALKKPAAEPVAERQQAKAAPQRSPLISKFGANATVHHDMTPQPVAKHDAPIAPAQIHPTVAKVMQKQVPKPQATGTELKEQLIKERLAEAKPAVNSTPKKAWFKSKPRMATVLTVSLALLVLGGYLTYMNLPVISMKVAAARAGVAATLPEYHPDGYSLDGPITYSPGEVDIAYKSNTNDNNFKISQKQSNWDSQGLLDNYVTQQTQNYLTYQEHGVTVYTFGNKAAWVNGGLLYTLDGSASLSSDQVLRLATSM